MIQISTSQSALLTGAGSVELDACEAGGYSGAKINVNGYSNGLNFGLAQTLSRDIFPTQAVIASTVSYSGPLGTGEEPGSGT